MKVSNLKALQKFGKKTKSMPESPFGEIQVQLSKNFVKKIGEHAECDKILNGKDVRLSKDFLIGTWNGI